MAITGTKVFTSGEILTSANVNRYLMRGVKVFDTTTDRDNAYGGGGEPTLEEGETCYITASDELQSYDGAAWVKIGPTVVDQYPDLGAYGVATGGSSTSITVGGVNYTLLTFTSSLDLTVSTAGFFDFVFVGGGGAGGTGTASAVWSYGNVAGCGGGGGEVVFASVYVKAGTYPIIIGAGGASTLNGLATYIPLLGIGAKGGGGGGGTVGYPYFPVRSGGAGGGYQGSGVAGFGFAGIAAVSTTQGSGGGGVGGAPSGGTAGVGYDISVWIGGGSTLKGAGGAGGSSGGVGSAGTANSGNGGQGGGYASGTSAGGAGGSGIAYVRFRV